MAGEHNYIAISMRKAFSNHPDAWPDNIALFAHDTALQHDVSSCGELSDLQRRPLHRASAAFSAMALRCSAVRALARALPPAFPASAGRPCFGLSSASSLATWTIAKALRFRSAGRFLPLGTLGMVQLRHYLAESFLLGPRRPYITSTQFYVSRLVPTTIHFDTCTGRHVDRPASVRHAAVARRPGAVPVGQAPGARPLRMAAHRGRGGDDHAGAAWLSTGGHRLAIAAAVMAA
jgi:hypothetical protein